jgi:prepilin-type N-terminal cleavage/methylation domain-containing protein
VQGCRSHPLAGLEIPHSCPRAGSAPRGLGLRRRATSPNVLNASPITAFTLIELLVTVAILGILFSLLLPSLVRAKEQAARVQCLSNLRQIGHAVSLYAEDNDDTLPTVEDWPAIGGRRGTSIAYSSDLYDPTNRPLNAYVGYTLDVFRCPRDKGDALTSTSTPLWQAYGNSYFMQCGEDSYRIKYVTALRSGAYGAPVKRSSLIRLDNKIMVGDWPLHANRPITDKRSQWHNSGEKRAFCIVFGDSHAEYFSFPKSYGIGDAYEKGNPNYLWW